MTDHTVTVTFEAEYTMDVAPPFDEDALKQVLQSELGFSGILVTEVIFVDDQDK